jgi:hypothetical protein
MVSLPSMGVGVAVGVGEVGGRDVAEGAGVSERDIVGETGIAVGGSEVPQAAVNRVNTANKNLIFFIGLILAHMILMPNRINQTRQDLSKPWSRIFSVLYYGFFCAIILTEYSLLFSPVSVPSRIHTCLSFAAYPTA